MKTTPTEAVIVVYPAAAAQLESDGAGGVEEARHKASLGAVSQLTMLPALAPAFGLTERYSEKKARTLRPVGLTEATGLAAYWPTLHSELQDGGGVRLRSLLLPCCWKRCTATRPRDEGLTS